MPDNSMMEVIRRLKASIKRVERARRASDRREAILKQEGLPSWKKLLEWTEECCALFKPAGTLKFTKVSDQVYTVLFDARRLTVRVTFDESACTISYVLESPSQISLSAAAKCNGQFYPQVKDDKLLFADGPAGDNVDIRKVGKAMLLLLE